MNLHSIRIYVCAASCLAIGLASARAELERYGPVDQTNGYPTWYQDTTGLTLEFGAPLNQAELEEGWTLLLPEDVPSGTAPETFPSNFADEHFYWAGDANIDAGTVNGIDVRARLILGLEAAFGIGPVAAGDQVVFGRLRIRINDLPYNGTYTVYTPYGVRTFTGQVRGERLFHTEDIGLAAPPGDFSAALLSSIGPFLLPSNTAGGAELAAVTGPVPGKLYIADPAREGPVTGSPYPPFVSAVDSLERNHNIFRVEGPNGFVLETYDFALVGRIYTGPIPARVSIDRASYVRTANTQKLNVFATGLPTTQGRLPANPIPPAIMPILSFYNAPPNVDPITEELSAPIGQVAVPMANSGHHYWAQSEPPSLPSAITMEDSNARDANNQIMSMFYQAPVTDEVAIAGAIYDPANGGSLSVLAWSSDALVIPTLTLSGYGDLVNEQIIVAPLAAPSATVRVVSSAGGSDIVPVIIGGQISGAANDNVTVDEDSGQTNVNVLANDTLDGAPIVFGPDVTVAILVAPQKGIAVVNPDGTIGYTPNPDVNGSDSLVYTVTVGLSAPAAATLSITITPVDDPPEAFDDQATLDEDTSLDIDILGNDLFDHLPLVFGPGVIVTIVNEPAQGTAVVNGNGTIGYTPNPDVFGPDSLTYKLTVGGMDSNEAVVAIAILPVNDPPVANDDTFSVQAGTATLNVLANDTDVDSPMALATAVIETQPGPGATATGGASVVFSANQAGVFTFTYRAQDQFGALSATAATVTVTVSASEVINIQQATFRTDARRWIVSGVDSLRLNQTLTISYANGTLANGSPAAGTAIGTAVVTGAGSWLLDIRGVSGVLDPTSRTAFRTLPTQIRVTSPLGGSQVATINIRS